VNGRPDTPTDASPPVLVLRNEFARVEVRLDRSANGDRLEVTDVNSGRRIYLDPLELERLTAARHHDLAQLVAPTDPFAQVTP
jgi:hypothetical protein